MIYPSLHIQQESHKWAKWATPRGAGITKCRVQREQYYVSLHQGQLLILHFGLHVLDLKTNQWIVYVWIKFCVKEQTTLFVCLSIKGFETVSYLRFCIESQNQFYLPLSIEVWWQMKQINIRLYKTHQIVEVLDINTFYWSWA